MFRWLWNLFASFEGDVPCERCARCRCLEIDLGEAKNKVIEQRNTIETQQAKIESQDLIIADFVRITSVDTAYMTQQ